MSGIINHIMTGTSSNSRRSNSNSRIRHPVISTTTTGSSISTTPTLNINGMNYNHHQQHNTIQRLYNTTTTTTNKRIYCLSMKYIIGICIGIIFIIFIIVQHIMISILYNHHNQNEHNTIHSHLQIQQQQQQQQRQQYKNSMPSSTSSSSTTSTRRIINQERNVVEQHVDDEIDLSQLDAKEYDIITYKESKYINCDLLSMPTIYNLQQQQRNNNQKRRRIHNMIYNLCYNITTTRTTTTNNNNNIQRQYLFYNPLENVKRYVCYNNHNNHNNDKDNTIPVLGKTYVTIESTKCYKNNDDPLVLLQPTYRLFSVQPIELDNTQDLTTTTNTIQQLAKHQIPIQTSFVSKPNQLFDTCDIPCLYDGPPGGVLCTRTIINTPDTSIWKITFSMEGPQYYNTLYIEPNAYKENHFYSTTSYNSDIPLPYYSRAEYNIYHNHYVPYNTGIKGAVFLARNCGSMNNREQIVSDMINISQHMNNNNHNNSTTNLFRVDSLSSCLHNANPPPGIYGLENKIKVMQQYLFYLAFENQCENDYITEKLWGPYEAGTIPIYYGAPNIKDHVPYHSFIHVTDYNTTNDLIQHLILIANNRTIYESYHKWRTEPIPYHFHLKYDITDTHSTCRTCRWAYARIHGIGWNHTTQSLRPLLNIHSRLLCFDITITTSTTNNDNAIVKKSISPLLIQHPFIEEWVYTNANDDNTIVPIQPIILSSSTTTSNNNNQKDNNNNNKGCKIPLDDTNRMIDIDNGKVQRTVYNHDGVIDMFVQLGYNNDNDIDINESKSSILRLRLKMPLLHDPIIFRPIRDNNNVWQYQNSVTRYTIIIVPAKTSSSSSTTDTVVLQYDKDNKYLYLDITNISIRIRIIVEDIDTVHDGAHEFENYFGRLMTNDFLNPIQRYVQLLPSTTSSSSSS